MTKTSPGKIKRCETPLSIMSRLSVLRPSPGKIKLLCGQGQLCIAKEDKLLNYCVVRTSTYCQGREQLSNAKEDKVLSGTTKQCQGRQSVVRDKISNAKEDKVLSGTTKQCKGRQSVVRDN